MLHDLPLFAGCSESEVSEWLSNVPHRREHFEKDARIVRQGDACRSVYILARGTTRTEMEQEYKDLTIDLLEAPVVLASAFLFASESRFPVSVFAVTDCEIWIINKDSFFAFLLQHPAAMQRFVQDISDRCAFLSRKLRSFALKSLRTRVLDLIRERGVMASVQFAAQALGVQRPSLSRVLADLQAEGLVLKTDEGFVLAR